MTFFDIDLAHEANGFRLDYRLATDSRSVGVFGPSGAGKTTLLEIVAGWRRPTRGTIRIGERTLFDSATGVDVRPAERRIGYVPQDILLFPHWSVLENVTASPGSGEFAERVLDMLELAPLRDRSVLDLSGGERHRVALARALCSEPQLLLLDEPLSSLDAPLKRRILGDLVRVQEEFDLPMLVISHDPTVVQVLCHHAQYLEAGEVQDDGPPATIVAGVADADFENVVRGTVSSVSEHGARVMLEGDVSLGIPRSGLQPGDAAILGIRADEPMLALQQPIALSARNVLGATVEEVRSSGDARVVRVRLQDLDADWWVNVTDDAVEALTLERGRDVFVVLKSRSIHVLGVTSA